MKCSKHQLPSLSTIGILLIIFLSVLLNSSCDEECIVGQSKYEWTTKIEGEDRRAIIWKPQNECIKAPILIYLHGRGGWAEDSENRRKFHDLMPDSYIVYGEGTNFDNRADGKKGWETRFPHIEIVCNLDKDLKYIEKLLEHLGEDDKADLNNVGVCGHSSGGFFTLTLASLMKDKFKGFAALGAYTSYIVFSSKIDCEDTYEDAMNLSLIKQANVHIPVEPVPTFFLLGKLENTIKPNSEVYKSDCSKFSYFQNSIIQLCIKNNSVLPDCAQENFMDTEDLQIFPGAGGNSAETRVKIYNNDHSWPVEANAWVADYFIDLLYP